MNVRVPGGYTLHEAVGSGSTATVYRATRGEETVAVKMLHPHLAQDPVIRSRFLREVTLARRLTHPCVVRVYDLVTPDDPEEPPCVVMEYCSGGNLVGWKAGSAEEVVSVARDVAGALAAAHRAGLIHRDLKPSNILRDVGGRYRVCDFGSAGVQDSVSLSTSSLFLDAPFFVAPEVFEGHPADPRSDLYSLGAVLHAAATGRQARDRVLPRPGADRAAERRQLEQTLPAWLADLILQLLEPLNTRTPDAATVLRALEGGGAPSAMALKRCLFCGAHLPADAPLCLSCGQEEVGRELAHGGQAYCVVLRSVREDARTLERLTEILRILSGNPIFELELMFGDPRYYSREERKRKRKLPVRMVEDLSAGDAERLGALLQSFKVRATARRMGTARGRRQGPLVRLRQGPVRVESLDTLRQASGRLPGLPEPWMRDLVARLVFAVYGLEKTSRTHALGDLLRPMATSLNSLTRRLSGALAALGTGGIKRAELAAEVARATWDGLEPGTEDADQRRRAALAALEKIEETDRRRADVVSRILRLCGALEGVNRDFAAALPDREGEVKKALAELEEELALPPPEPADPDTG